MKKRCPDCGQTKSLTEFPRNRRSKDGRATYCKPSHNARTRASIRRTHGSSRHYHLKQRFGIGEAEVGAMIDEQGGVCKACGDRPATQVDHNHETGEARGILCLQCNAALGALKEDPRNIWAAVDYLESARGRTVEILGWIR